MKRSSRNDVIWEPGLLALIRTTMKERGISFKVALNSALRAALTQRKPRRRSFVQKPCSLGGDPSFRWDKAPEAAAAMEEKLGRKFALRK